jgi:hypothetical protein
MKQYIIEEKELKDIISEIKELEKLLTERIQDLHEIKGMMQARHAYILYRDRLWQINDLVFNSYKKHEQVNNLLDGFDSWLFEKKIKVNLLEFNDGKYDHLWRSPNEQVNYSTRELFSMYLDTKE